MKIQFILIITTIILCVSKTAFAQILHPVAWSYAAKRTGKTETTVMLKATVENGWHIYSTHQKDGGPIKTTFVFTPSSEYSLSGTIIEPKPVSKYEETFSMQVDYFEHSVVFQQKVKLKHSPVTVKGKLNYMVCNDHQCLPPEDVEFTIPVK